MKRMPVIFSGHGSPMLALEKSSVTDEITEIGNKIINKFGKPKAILAISAHWYMDGTFVQSADKPEQIYDMYGFPEKLYELQYPVHGNMELTEDVKTLLGDIVTINDHWGIDHGTWTVLIHMFPNADTPVVQLSVNGNLTTAESFELGRKLIPLRNKGYLIFGTGNVVHNLDKVEWNNPNGNIVTDEFDDYIRDAIFAHDYEKVLNYTSNSFAGYSAPWPDHILPLIYILGSSDGDDAKVFNNIRRMATMSMTGYTFGL